MITIAQDLSAIAYVNELQPRERVKVNRDIEAGEEVFVRDIDDIDAVELGIDIPADSGVIIVRSFGWKRSLFYDVTPLGPEREARDYPLEAVLAKQALLLLGLPIGEPNGASLLTRAEHMAQGVARLEQLLRERCEEESKYQELLEEHPWMLGQTYSKVVRHQKFDDTAIPDFTVVRIYDGCHDIIELKHPFVPLFKGADQFAAGFNDAWNQAEGYVAFTTRNRDYLLREKKLRFEDPRCLLICGQGLSEEELAKIREKTWMSQAIKVFSYDQLLGIARHVVELVRTTGDMKLPETAG